MKLKWKVKKKMKREHYERKRKKERRERYAALGTTDLYTELRSTMFQ